MNLLFRIECPHCHWGHTWSDTYINQGWLTLSCTHCGENFHTKVTVTGVNVEIAKDLPEGVPCMTLPEARSQSNP
jgi:transcription elongation factor Elf1